MKDSFYETYNNWFKYFKEPWFSSLEIFDKTFYDFQWLAGTMLYTSQFHMFYILSRDHDDKIPYTPNGPAQRNIPWTSTDCSQIIYHHNKVNII